MPAGRILHGNKGYDSNAIRRQVEENGTMPNIPPKATRRWKNCFSPALYRDRNAIERIFCRLKDFRRVATAVGRRRPVYERAIRRLRRGDMFVVWDIDRAFRSTRDALNELDALHRRGVEFLIANLRIDATTPEGYYVYTVLSANAELGRRTLSRRTREGLAAARLRGAWLGRPRKLSEEQLVEARDRLAEGRETVTAVAADYEVAPWPLTRALRRWGLAP